MISILILSFLYLITRLPFIHSFPLYYDSFEYVRIVDKLNYHTLLPLISNSHQPIHTLYFISAFVSKLLLPSASTEFSMVVLSLIFGYLTVLFWFLVVRTLFKENIALYATIILLLFPLFFITNTNITYESELLFFQILSLYLLVYGIKKNKQIYMFISGLILGLAHLIFIGTLFVVPVYFFIIYKNVNFRLDPLVRGEESNNIIKNITKIIINITLFIVGYVITGFLLDYLLISSLSLLVGKYTSHASDIVSNNQGVIIFVGRIIRNIIFQSIMILSPGGSILVLLSTLLILFIKRLSKLKYLFLFLIPYFALMQYWHAGLFGRLALGIMFPSSLIITLVFHSAKMKAGVLTVLSLFYFVLVFQQANTPALYKYYNLIKNQKNIAVITSDFNRFIYEKYNISHFAIKGTTTQKEVGRYIDLHAKNEIVLIDSAALRYPYFQYDGYSYGLLSINKKGVPLIGSLMDEYISTKYLGEINSDIFFLKVGKRTQ